MSPQAGVKDAVLALGLRASPSHGLLDRHPRADPVPAEAVLGLTRLSQAPTTLRDPPSTHRFIDLQRRVRLPLTETPRPGIDPMLLLHIPLTSDIETAMPEHRSTLHSEKILMKKDRQRLQGLTDAADLSVNRLLELWLETTNNPTYHTPPTVITDPRLSSHPQLTVKSLVGKPLKLPAPNRQSQRQHHRPSGTN